MTNFIPVFPLRIVVYPGEVLNLHIFEPRYKQMIHDCIAAKKPFGLPPVMSGDGPGELGTLLEITELAKEYEDGSMDVRTRGTAVFRILQLVDSIPDKLYSGAIVTYPGNVMARDSSAIAQRIVEEVRRMYVLLSAEAKLPAERTGVLSYELAHYVGLSAEQEYELLGLFTELQRLEYIRRHLKKMVPLIQELEGMKERIQRNGHFRNLSLGN